MKRIWFIQDNGQHVGPFNEMEIEALFREKKLESSSKLWSKGLLVWQSIDTVSEFSHLFEQEKVEELIEEDTEDTNERFVPPPVDEIPPDLPKASLEEVDLRKENIVEEARLEKKIENDEDFLQPTELVKDEESSNLIKEVESFKRSRSSFIFTFFKVFSVAFLIITTMFLVSYYYFVLKDQTKNTEINTNKLSDLQKEQLISTIELSSKFPVFTLLIDKGFHDIYISSNIVGEKRVRINLKSIDKEIISDQLIEFNAEFVMSSEWAKITNIKFLHGSKILEGNYRVNIIGLNNSLRCNLRSRVYDIAHTIIPRFLLPDKCEKNISFESKVFFSNRSYEKFYVVLKEFWKFQRNKRLNDQKEFLDSVASFNSLILQIKDLYTRKIDIYTKGSSVRSFEKEYIKKISNPLQRLTLRCSKNVLKDYKNKKLTDLWKNISESSYEIYPIVERLISRTKKHGRLTSKVKRILLEASNDDFSKILRELNQLKSEIKE